MASMKSWEESILNPRKDENDFTGLIQNGYDSPTFTSAASSNGSNTEYRGVCSGTICPCTSRLQYLCSHLSTLSRVGVRWPRFRRSTGIIVLAGKSKWLMMASTEPENERSRLSALRRIWGIG